MQQFWQAENSNQIQIYKKKKPMQQNRKQNNMQ